MAIQLFGGRPVIKKRVVVPLQTTDLGARLEGAAGSGGGIQAGAHPEYEKGTQLGNPFKQLADLFKKKRTSK